jgi:transposase-like protein
MATEATPRSDIVPITSLPPKKREKRTAVVNVTMEPGLKKWVKALAKRHDTTASTVLYELLRTYRETTEGEGLPRRRSTDCAA